MQNKIRSFNRFKTTLEKGPIIQQEFKSDPLEAIKKFQSVSRFNDKQIYRLAVLFLGLIVLTICIGAIILTGLNAKEKGFEVPDILVATASTAIGAVAGLLTPGSYQDNGSE